MKKKALAFALVLCMVIAMLPVSVFAAQPQSAPAQAEGPEIRYQLMSDVQPMSGVQVQPTEIVDGYELIIQQTEGGVVYYTINDGWSDFSMFAYPDEGYYLAQVIIEYTEGFYTPEVNYIGFNEFVGFMHDGDVRITFVFDKVQGKAHKIKVVSDANGTYTVTRTTAHAGEFFEVETFPDLYYNEFCRLKDSKGREIDYYAHGDKPNRYSYIMPDCDVTLYVEFDRYGPYTLSVKPFNQGGTISVPVERAYYGEVVPITVIPNPGYKVHYIDMQSWGAETSSIAYAGNNIWNLTMGNGDLRIYISFSEIINPVTVNCGPGGTASANVAQAKPGETVTVTCQPEENYRVYSITGAAGIVDNGDNTYSFTMPEKAVTIDVTFKTIYNPVSVTVETGLGGSAITNVLEAKAGDTVTLTAIPEEGYRVAAITGVKNLTDNGDNTYTFTMPDEAVNIKVLFLRHENPFLDVNETHFFYTPVLWAVENGITSGISADAFGPMAVCNRAQVVTFLWRYAGCPEPTATENPFIDVQAGSFYEKAVLWAVENGITNGVSANEFGPGLACNRAQVVTFLWRLMKQPTPATTEHPFTDVIPGSFYEQPVLWALENGITTGATATTFNPGGECLRAQVVTFLYRTAQLPPPPVFYALEADFDAQMGTVTLSHTEAQAGETVTVTATPNEGYLLESVICASGAEVTQVSETEFTFVMGEAAETITVTFAPVPTEPTEPEEPTDPTDPKPTTYELVLKDNGHGTVTHVDVTSAAPGESIFFYAVPDEGYFLERVGIFNPDNAIDVSQIRLYEHEDNLYELVMINHDIIMTLYFSPIPG